MFRVFTGPLFIPGRAWLKLDKREQVSFHVRGCSNAHVILTSAYGMLSKDTLEVVLGTVGNTRVGTTFWFRSRQELAVVL